MPFKVELEVPEWDVDGGGECNIAIEGLSSSYHLLKEPYWSNLVCFLQIPTAAGGANSAPNAFGKKTESVPQFTQQIASLEEGHVGETNHVSKRARKDRRVRSAHCTVDDIHNVTESPPQYVALQKESAAGTDDRSRKRKKNPKTSNDDNDDSSGDRFDKSNLTCKAHIEDTKNHHKNKIMKVVVASSLAGEGSAKHHGKKIKSQKFKTYRNGNTTPATAPSASKTSATNRSNVTTGTANKRVSKAQKRLQGARFRMLNEKLYTTTGAAAFDLFSSNPELFSVYHEGFQAQVEKWPINPVRKAIEWIRTHQRGAVVADFGCGEAAISQAVPNTVHSFDLVAHNDHVTACDIAHVPLADNCVDVAVFCLALMGTNYIDYVKEAHRVLREIGSMCR